MSKLPRARTQFKKLRLMYEAVDRYLDLCREGSERGVCECGEHENNCPLEERPCLPHSGGLCHWCQLDAARRGIDYRDVESRYAEARKLQSLIGKEGEG